MLQESSENPSKIPSISNQEMADLASFFELLIEIDREQKNNHNNYETNN